MRQVIRSTPNAGIPTELDSARSFAAAAHLGRDPRHLAMEKTMKVDITSMPIGEKPPGFTEGLTGQGDPVRWQVLSDETAPVGRVIAETSRDTADYRFPICVCDSITAKDVTVSVRFKAVAGEVDQAAGLIVRAQDDMNFYVARANALEANVRLYKVTNGVRRQIAGRNIDVPSGAWQNLSLAILGNALVVTFNGERVIETQDTTFPNSGKVGLWTKADSLTYFAELQIEPAADPAGHV